MKNKKMFKVIHVDADPAFRAHFKELLLALPEIEPDYLAGFDTPEKAMAFLDITNADLVFSEVEFPSNSGLWLAEQLQHRKENVVFVTTHPEYALEAYEKGALNYLVKPVTEEKLAAMLNRALAGKENDPYLRNTANNLILSRNGDKIYLNVNNITNVIKLKDIIYFASSKNYTYVIMQDGSRQLAAKPINIFEKGLEQHPDFVKVSRSLMINKNHVLSIQRNHKTRHISLLLTNEELILTSFKTKEEAIAAMM
jgi:DNA-binding LytR/AlgR family response regulator